MMSELRSRDVLVDGIRTRYTEAGDGERTIVLLHAGSFGEDSLLSWERNVPALARRYRVVAPDWLGFGGTDKVRDFTSGSRRMLVHMSRFLEILCIDRAHFGGVSMGGTALLRVAATGMPAWPIESIFVASGGGFVPDNEARNVLINYDQTRESMRALVRTAYADPRWAADEEFIERRWRNTLAPGAWEAVAAARFKAPGAAPLMTFGKPDDIPYEQIEVPVLYTVGGRDQLREPGYERDVVKRTPGAQIQYFPEAGHMVNVEVPSDWNAAVIEFLSRVEEQGFVGMHGRRKTKASAERPQC